MKRTMVFGFVGVVLVAAVALSEKPALEKELQIQIGDKNPWTSLKMNNDPDDFRFAVVSDRTGGHRPKIFSQAMQQINLLQPEFVMSVGDLIEGYSDKSDKVEQEWTEFQSYVKRLQMPFFYVPGNHDITNAMQEKMYREKYRAPYYHFVYRNVLFLCLSSEDPPVKGNEDSPRFSKAQLDYMKKAIEDNSKAKWIFTFLHKPLWNEGTIAINGWLDYEKLLVGKNHTVFAGHVHHYQKFQRNGMRYYSLATTGGGSKLRGTAYGEFDHFAWVTMKKSGPIVANLLLDGILDDALQIPESDETGVATGKRKQTFITNVKVTQKGVPLSEAEVVFHQPGKPKAVKIGDGLTNQDGVAKITTYSAFDGVPEGEYTLTVIKRSPRTLNDGKAGPNLLPAGLSKVDTSTLKAVIKAGDNNINIPLD